MFLKLLKEQLNFLSNEGGVKQILHKNLLENLKIKKVTVPKIEIELIN